ncbi:hypothetical protein ACC776_37270, partial [Rhizobium johnstonii]
DKQRESRAAAPSLASNPSIDKNADWSQAFGLREMCVFYALLLLVIVLSFTTAYLGKSNYISVLNVTNVGNQDNCHGNSHE